MREVINEDLNDLFQLAQTFIYREWFIKLKLKFKDWKVKLSLDIKIYYIVTYLNQQLIKCLK